MPVIARTLALALGLAGAVTLSQGPEFVQQYRQRLGGAVDELRRVVARFDADAAATGRTREAAIEQLRANPDDLASAQGAAMRDHVARLGRLEDQRDRLAEAGPFRRLAVYLAGPDLEVSRAAFRDFEPAVPVTAEGFASAGAGFVLLWGGALLLMRAGRRLMGLGRRRARAA